MKLSEFLDEFGFRQGWFADKIGMHRSAFNECLRGKKRFPQKYWKKIIEMTNKKVKIEDLFYGEKRNDDTEN
jgi:hypothetical protein